MNLGEDLESSHRSDQIRVSTSAPLYFKQNLHTWHCVLKILQFFQFISSREKKKLTADSVIFKESESLLPQYSENTHTHTHFSEVLMQRNDSVTFQFVWKLRLGWRVRYSLQTKAGWSRPPPPPPPPPPWEIEMGVFCRHKQPGFLAPVQVGVRGQRRGRGRGREGEGVKQDGWERMINVRRAGRGLGRL